MLSSRVFVCLMLIVEGGCLFLVVIRKPSTRRRSQHRHRTSTVQQGKCYEGSRAVYSLLLLPHAGGGTSCSAATAHPRPHTAKQRATHSKRNLVLPTCALCNHSTAMSILIHDFGSNIRFAAEVVTAKLGKQFHGQNELLKKMAPQ